MGWLLARVNPAADDLASPCSSSGVLQIVGLISHIKGLGLAFVEAIEAPVFEQLDGQIKVVRGKLIQPFDGGLRL